MDLAYSGQEVIPAPPDRVWAFISDAKNVASCLPDLIESKVEDDRHVQATVKVAVGPVRGKFTFKIALDPQPSAGRMNMRIAGGGFGSVVDLDAGATIAKNGDSATTLDWEGKASMRGPVATVGGRVLDAQAKRVITSTFANVRAKLTPAA